MMLRKETITTVAGLSLALWEARGLVGVSGTWWDEALLRDVSGTVVGWAFEAQGLVWAYYLLLEDTE